jgi:hypothetical protein
MKGGTNDGHQSLQTPLDKLDQALYNYEIPRTWQKFSPSPTISAQHNYLLIIYSTTNELRFGAVQMQRVKRIMEATECQAYLQAKAIDEPTRMTNDISRMTWGIKFASKEFETTKPWYDLNSKTNRDAMNIVESSLNFSEHMPALEEKQSCPSCWRPYAVSHPKRLNRDGWFRNLDIPVSLRCGHMLCGVCIWTVSDVSGAKWGASYSRLVHE